MRSIELFAGAGGLGMGVSLAGFRPAEVVEWNSYCCETLRENGARRIAPVDSWPLTQCDVREVDFSGYEEKIELVTGGPPCQPFSIGGKHRAHRDGRDMFPEAVRALREVKPQAFIFENVKGLTRQSFRNYFEYIRLQMIHPEFLRRLMRAGKSISSGWNSTKQVEAGAGLPIMLSFMSRTRPTMELPQRRERVFFAGFRSDLNIGWSFPRETHSADALAWDQYRDGSYWGRHNVRWNDRVLSEGIRTRAWRLSDPPATKPWRTVRDALVGLPDPEVNPRLSKKHLNHKFQPGARAYVGHSGSAFDEPAKTLKAGVHGVPGGENMLLKPDGSVRYFSVRESARLQTFPDEYVFLGAWSEAMRQLGNAVPVTLARIVAEDVMRHLDNPYQVKVRSTRPERTPRKGGH